MHARDVTIAVITASLLEAALAFGLGIITPGYSLVHDYISTSSATDAPYAGHGFFLGMAGAALHLVFVRAMWETLGANLWGRITALCFGAFFIFIAFSALFQCDPGCAVETAEAVTHTVLGFVAFTFLGLAAIGTIVYAVMQKPAGHRALVVVSVILIISDLSLLAGHLLRLMPGLVERSTIVAMWLLTWVWFRSSRLSEPVGSGN